MKARAASRWPLAGCRPASRRPCKGTVYLTFDTGHMEPAEAIADILDKYAVKATFFLANEKTKRGDTSLDASWAPFWKRLAGAGHAFGSHTWRHWYFAGDTAAGKVRYAKPGTTQGEILDAPASARELSKPEGSLPRHDRPRLRRPVARARRAKTAPRPWSTRSAAATPTPDGPPRDSAATSCRPTAFRATS
ncbi:MAG: polysaccharide deacetylase family protein [Betaproteobacteria bacterium]|nr:polysaccharide deacetylase family protein [Betaproteobacteria bacterium]